MPLGGTGGALGSVLAGAVGAPSSAGSLFAKLGGQIADWAPAHIVVKPGVMVAASGAVAGLGTFEVNGTKEDLGALFANVLEIPATASDARAKWITVAEALIDHFNDYGQANGTGLTSGAPCGGVGTLQWKSPTFVPPLAQRLEVDDVVAAAALEAFAVQLLSHIQTNASVVAISLADPPLPLTAPTDGAVTGSGSIA
jgi:hypothetical protein